MRKAILKCEIDLSKFGGITEAFHTPDQPGRILWVQTKGVFQSKVYNQITRGMYSRGIKGMVARAARKSNISIPGFHLFHPLRNDERDIFSMILTDTRGKKIWQYGQPYHDRYYCSHQGENIVGFADVNADGKTEIITIYEPGKLGVFSVDSGKLLGEVELPADNFSMIKTAKSGKGPMDFTILVGNSETAYPPHIYSNPIILFDAKLNVICQHELPGGIGHSVQVFDADGDGNEEFFAGYTLINHDGSIIWTAEPRVTCLDNKSAAAGHADCSAILYSKRDSDWKVAVAGSNRLFMFNSQGEKLWDREVIHSQYLLVGRFLPGDENIYIFHIQCRHVMELIDLNGNLIWKGKLPSNWPAARPSLVPNDDCFHMGRPASLLNNPFNDGNDLIVYNEAGWPYAVDGLGDKKLIFPYPESALQGEHPFPAGFRPDDFGYGYRAVVADIDGNGREEVIVHDRDTAWIYGLG